MLGIFATVVFGIVIYISFIFFEFYRNFCRKVKYIDQIPGPKGYPLIGNALDLTSLASTELLDYLEKGRKTHGTVFRIWIGFVPVIFISDPRGVQTILNSRAALNKSWNFYFFNSGTKDSLFALEGSEWYERRKLLDPSFRYHVLERYVPTIFEICESFNNRLSNMVNEGTFDVYPFVSKLAFCMLCETVMGTKFDIQKEECLEYFKNCHLVVEAVYKRMLKPYLWNDFCYSLTETHETEKKGWKLIKNLVAKVIEEKKRKKMAKSKNIETEARRVARRRTSLLDFLLDNAQHSSISTNGLLNEANIFIIAGSGLISSSIGLALHFLGAYPIVQDKAVEEIRSVFGNSSGSPTIDKLSRLNYLEQVIKETLRLANPVSFIGRCVNEDIKLGKYTIPAGTQVILDFNSMHKDKMFFPNSSTFDPDHFCPDQVSGRHPYAFVPFSSSYRNCIAQKLAMLEIKMALALLLRQYKIETKQTLEEVHLAVGGMMQPQNGVRISLKLRE